MLEGGARVSSGPEQPESFKNKVGSDNVKGPTDSGEVMRRAARAHHEHVGRGQPGHAVGAEEQGGALLPKG